MTRTTRPPRRAPHARPAVLALAAVVLAACGDAGMVQPPEPEPEPAPELTRLVLDFNYIEVIKDCDGIEGDGEFSFRVRASRSFGGTSTVHNRSHQLGDGDRTGAIGRLTTSTEAVAGKQVTVELRASEVDQNIFTGAYNDERMSNATRTLAHSFNGTNWGNLGPRTISVGSGNCQVRLHYTASQS